MGPARTPMNRGAQGPAFLAPTRRGVKNAARDCSEQDYLSAFWGQGMTAPPERGVRWYRVSRGGPRDAGYADRPGADDAGQGSADAGGAAGDQLDPGGRHTRDQSAQHAALEGEVRDCGPRGGARPAYAGPPEPTASDSGGTGEAAGALPASLRG